MSFFREGKFYFKNIKFILCAKDLSKRPTRYLECGFEAQKKIHSQRKDKTTGVIDLKVFGEQVNFKVMNWFKQILVSKELQNRYLGTLVFTEYKRLKKSGQI